MSATRSPSELSGIWGDCATAAAQDKGEQELFFLPNLSLKSKECRLLWEGLG